MLVSRSSRSSHSRKHLQRGHAFLLSSSHASHSAQIARRSASPDAIPPGLPFEANVHAARARADGAGGGPHDRPLRSRRGRQSPRCMTGRPQSQSGGRSPTTRRRLASRPIVSRCAPISSAVSLMPRPCNKRRTAMRSLSGWRVSELLPVGLAQKRATIRSTRSFDASLAAGTKPVPLQPAHLTPSSSRRPRRNARLPGHSTTTRRT